MTDTTDTTISDGNLYIDGADPRPLLKSLGGMKASEYESMLAAGIEIDKDPIRFTCALGWLKLRRSEPGLTWEAAQDRIVIKFSDRLMTEVDAEADAEADVEADPPVAGS